MKRNRKNSDLEEPESKKCRYNFDELKQEITSITSNKVNQKYINILKEDLNILYNKKIF
jgi:hypothetical protein